MAVFGFFLFVKAIQRSWLYQAEASGGIQGHSVMFMFMHGAFPIRVSELLTKGSMTARTGLERGVEGLKSSDSILELRSFCYFVCGFVKFNCSLGEAGCTGSHIGAHLPHVL